MAMDMVLGRVVSECGALVTKERMVIAMAKMARLGTWLMSLENKTQGSARRQGTTTTTVRGMTETAVVNITGINGGTYL